MKNFYLVILFVISAFTQVNADVERRAAIDIGSGGTKVAIADVDTETNQIVQIVLDTSFPVPYQASLDKSADGTFDVKTKELGLKTFKEIKEIADQYQVQKTGPSDKKDLTALQGSLKRIANFEQTLPFHPHSSG